MSEIIVVDEKYLAEYYEKRQMINKLKAETDEMSNNIKLSLIENQQPLGKTYGEYAACISIKHKLNSNFISLLKKIGKENLIHEICYIKECEDMVKKFNKDDKEKYYDEWYRQLFVRKVK